MKQLFSKKIKRFVFVLFTYFFFIQKNTPAFAQEHAPDPQGGGQPIEPGDYTPITQGLFSNGTDFSSVLQQLFQWGVGIAGILAVIMIVVGGIEYMGTDSFTKKDDGKKKIMAALGGLLIALSIILILTTIFGQDAGRFEIGF